MTTPLLITDQLLQLQPTDTMPEAGRKILLRYVVEMRHHEPLARSGEDIEGVHKMRVATRRLRTMYRVLGQYLSPDYRRGIPQPLRTTAMRLGEVRDLDVFLLNLNGYILTHLGGDGTTLRELIELKQKQHSVAREELLAWLESAGYQKFLHQFTHILQQPTDIDHLPYPKDYPRSPKAYRVDHVLPLVVYQCYEAIRRHETRFPLADIPVLHQIRIEGKRLRYVLEAFEGVLGETSQQVVAEVKALQDNLGEMNDAAVAIEKLQIARQLLPAEAYQGVDAYQKVWQTQLETHLKQFPAAWRKFKRLQVRQWLASAVAKL